MRIPSRPRVRLGGVVGVADRSRYGERLPRLGDVVHAQDRSAALDRDEGRSEAARQALARRLPDDRSEEALAARSDEHGTARGLAQPTRGGDERRALLRGLAKADAGVDDDARALDARAHGPLDGLGEL